MLISGSADFPVKECLQNSGIRSRHVTNDTILECVSLENIPVSCGGTLYHDQLEWMNFFSTLEPLQNQCLSSGRRLISVLSEIRASDAQGTPNRRQLHSQHRALSRALMDMELQTLRRTGAATIRRLQDRARRISRRDSSYTKKSMPDTSSNGNPLPDTTEHIVASNSNNSSNIRSNNYKSNQPDPCRVNTPDYIQTRLNEVCVVFNEVDRAAKRLESLTEQRRERIREMTRQKAVEEEISEVRHCLF